MWETNTFAASVHARLNVALGVQSWRVDVVNRGEGPDSGPAIPSATFCHKLRNTVAGFWFKASSVPASPSPTVTTRAEATTPAALPACQT